MTASPRLNRFIKGLLGEGFFFMSKSSFNKGFLAIDKNKKICYNFNRKLNGGFNQTSILNN
jgi:hypothetical protein